MAINNISKEQVSHELAQQADRIRCTADDDAWQLEDITKERRGIFLSFVGATGLGERGVIELRFDKSGLLASVLVEGSK